MPSRLHFPSVYGRSNPTLFPAETLAQIEEGVRLTSRNVGNLVHLEAPQKLLRHKPAAPLRNSKPELIDRRSDGLVLSYANMIRPRGESETGVEVRARDVGLLTGTQCPVFAFGIGIQDELAQSRDAIDPSLFTLLTTINRRAAIFGVRGEETEAWLHAVGLRKARALGCPSMFLYPRNIMAIRPPGSLNSPLRLATAGRLSGQEDDPRFAAIARIGEHFATSYVFQNDFFTSFHSVDRQAVIYNEATGEVLADHVKRRAERSGVDLPFSDYWMFRSTEKWRGFASGKNAYFGDRFHGGVVFMQAAKPAIIIQADARVRELVAFYDLPSATIEEVLGNDPTDILHERLSDAALRRMRETYARRYRAFYDTVRDAGLAFYNDITPDEVDRMVE